MRLTSRSYTNPSVTFGLHYIRALGAVRKQLEWVAISIDTTRDESRPLDGTSLIPRNKVMKGSDPINLIKAGWSVDLS